MVSAELFIGARFGVRPAPRLGAGGGVGLAGDFGLAGDLRVASGGQLGGEERSSGDLLAGSPKNSPEGRIRDTDETPQWHI